VQTSNSDELEKAQDELRRLLKSVEGLNDLIQEYQTQEAVCLKSVADMKSQNEQYQQQRDHAVGREQRLSRDLARLQQK